MRIIGSALLFSTALLLGSAAAIALQDIPKYDSSEVLVLGDNNHAEFLNAFTLALIAYFAPCTTDMGPHVRLLMLLPPLACRVWTLSKT